MATTAVERIDLVDVARSVLGIPPANTGDELAAMRAEHTKLRAMIDGLGESLLGLKRAAYSLERELMLAEGRSHLLHFSWIEAWLEGRHEDCANILASEEYRRELRAGVTL